MTYLKLSNSDLLAMVDNEDYSRCTMYTWNLHKHSGQVNARVRGVVTPLAKYIMKDKTKKWDHKDRNKLNNQKENLREATHQQNAFNSNKRKDGLCEYKGVTYLKHRNTYQARLTLNGKKKHLGTFYTAEDAALAYNKAAQKFFGEFANLNQIKNTNKS